LKIFTKKILLATLFFVSPLILAQESAIQEEPQKVADSDVSAVIDVIAVANPKVVLKTNIGEIELELFPEQAPISVKNFLQYVNDGFYDGLIFHRVIYNFMIQSGGFDANLQQKKATYAAIENEASNGLTNDKGTLAMARTTEPNSATSQFYINMRDNNDLNYGPRMVKTSMFKKREKQIHPGYAVFGKVTKGMEIAEKIAAIDVVYRGGMRDVPKENIIILKAEQISE